MAQADSKKLVENLNAERVEKLVRGADSLQVSTVQQLYADEHSTAVVLSPEI